MEMYADLFQKISGTCFQKCASRKHRDGDLALGEMACTDRCVSKYSKFGFLTYFVRRMSACSGCLHGTSALISSALFFKCISFFNGTAVEAMEKVGVVLQKANEQQAQQQQNLQQMQQSWGGAR